MSAPALPPVAPDVLADAVDSLPGRLRKRLDETVALVAGWATTVDEYGTVSVVVDGQTTVTLAALVRAAGDAVCGCLLAPKCLHRTAILAAAPVLDSTVGLDDAIAEISVTVDQARPTGLIVTADVVADPVPAAVAAGATRLWQAAASVLETGIPGAGAVVQAALLRAVHEGRAAGLHRASAAAVRVVESLRGARADEPGFRLADLTDDLNELLMVCHQLTGGHGDLALARGTARREYEDVGGLRLWGLFTEPVLARSGYAGAVTYLCDQDSRLWTVSDLRPGSMAAARSAAQGAVTLGEVRLSHQEAARAGLVVSGARASASGRLSTSARTQAVRSAGQPWTVSPSAGLWVSIDEQLHRFRDALGLPVPVRPAGYDLAFLDGVLRTTHNGLALLVDGTGPIALTAGLTDPDLPAVLNLRRLVRAAAGHRVSLIGRFAGARTVHALALAAVWLPERFGGHVDLVVDSLERSDLPGSVASDPVPMSGPATAVPAALQLLRHRVERAVSGGRAAVATPTAADARRLTRSHLPYGATVLAALHEVAGRRTRDSFGRLSPLNTERLATAWLAVAQYTAAAERHLATAGWST